MKKVLNIGKYLLILGAGIAIARFVLFRQSLQSVAVRTVSVENRTVKTTISANGEVKSNNEVVGLVIPQMLYEDVGTINYIGVIPAKRGNNYVKDLLAQGIENLIERDITEIIADIDVKNHPMENALQEMGFKEKDKLINYRKRLK